MDLHIHTTCSDGVKSPIQILEMAQQLNLEYISITDHDNCFAYEILETIDTHKYYNGKIIPGCELMTCADGIMIEILGYGVDWRKINEWARENYSPKNIELKETKMFEKLKNIILKFQDLQIDENLELPIPFPYSGYFKYMVYQNVKSYESNEEFLKKWEIYTYENFLRKGLSQKSSPIYFDQSEFSVAAKDIVDLIHKSGGLAFLAHLYKYPLTDHINFLRNIIAQNIKLDGIEACYSSFTKEQENKIIEFARENNLFLSGGSDYHGKEGRKEKLGYGTEKQRIPKRYLEEWYKNLNNKEVEYERAKV